MAQYIDKDALVAKIEKLRAKWFGINNNFADGQKGALTDVLSLINTLEVKEVDLEKLSNVERIGKDWKEDPVSEDLEEAIGEYCSNPDNFATWIGGKENDDIPLIIKAIKFGAQWQKQQFEKNRLKHCNSITNEQAELEQVFIDQHLDKHQRMPTILDAIEYGMCLLKQQMMQDAVSAYIRRNKHTKKNVLNGFDVTCEAVQKFKDKDKVKVVIIKEKTK